MNRSLYIVLRQSPDWKSITRPDFQKQAREFCRLIMRPVEQVNNYVDLWDTTFGIPYFAARQAMKELTLRNFQSVERASVVSLHQVVAGGTGLGVYLFIDDDDWIRPDILAAVEASECAGAEAFVWGSVAFGREEGPALTFRELDKTCYTNNYALDHRYFERQPSQAQGLCQHWEAESNIPKERLCLIPDYLTVTNKNPTSTLYLERELGETPTREALLKSVGRYNERLNDWEDRKAVAWARPYMVEVRDFFASVAASQINQ